MKKILSGSQYFDLQERMLQYEHIEHHTLLERMALSFVYGFRSLCNTHPNIYNTNNPEILVFAGPGLNGALALYIANQLQEIGYEVKTFLFYQKGHISDICDTARRQVLATELSIEPVIDKFSVPMITPTNIIVDGLYGVDLTTEPADGFDKLIQFLNEANAPIVSIDIPSGLYSEDNSLNSLEYIIRAKHTLTFYAPKRSFLYPKYAPFVGQWRLIDIGVSEEVLSHIETDDYLLDEQSVQLLKIPRPAFSSKSTYGEVVVVGGRTGQYGKLALTAEAALRAGCGDVSIHIPTQEGLFSLPALLPEATLLFWSQYLDSYQLSLLSPRAVYAFDSTLWLDDERISSLQDFLGEYAKPVVIDLEALYEYDHPKVILTNLPKGSILLARPKDFDRLTQDHFHQEKRFSSAQNFAEEYQVNLVLKGAYSAIFTPGRSVIYNSFGNAGMSTAGVGNVLTGIIASLLAQGLSPTTAATAGCFILGQAGDYYVGGHSMPTLKATDIIANLYQVFRQVD